MSGTRDSGQSRSVRPGIGRRSTIGAGLAAIAGLAVAGRAHAAPVTLKLAHAIPEGHPTTIRFNEAAERIRQLTNGAVVLRLFPNSQLGSQTDMISQVRSGAIDLTFQSSAVLSSIAPTSAIVGAAFVFPNYNSVWSAVDGPLGDYMRAEYAKANLVAMHRMWDSGFRHITASTRPIHTPEDLAGFKIRIPASPTWSILFAALGAAPTGLDLSELYSALQTKIVDGEENPLALISTLKFYEVQKYCSLTKHIWDGAWIIANSRSWSHLPANHQDIIEAQLNEAGGKQRADMEVLDTTLQAELTQKGLIINPVDIAPFRSKLQQAGY
jgi:TRAP-type transport system periplasmic protein